MKKLATACLAAALSLLFSIQTLAAPLTLAYDGKVVDYTGKTYSLKVNGESVKTDIPSVIIQEKALVPARAIFEKVGATVDWDAANQKILVNLNKTNIQLKINDNKAIVNDKPVAMEVPAKLINSKTMLPARFVAEQLNMLVGWVPEENLITIDKSSLRSVSATAGSAGDVVTLKLDYFKNYSIYTLSKDATNSDRLVIDFPNTKSVEVQQILDVNGSAIKDVRYRQTPYNSAIVVMDLFGPVEYKTEESAGQLVVTVTNQGSRGGADREGQGASSATGLTPTPMPAMPTAIPNAGPTPIPTPIPTPEPTPTPTPMPTPALPPQPLFGSSMITQQKEGNFDLVQIPIEGSKTYNIFRLTDPERIIIDVADQTAPSKTQFMPVSGGKLSAIRYNQFAGSSARIVMDISGNTDYSVQQQDGQITVKLFTPTYDNITYHNVGDRVSFSLKWTKLTDTEDSLKKLYTEKFDATGKRYTITFDGYTQEFGKGIMNINDGLIETVEINGDPVANKTSLTFVAKDKYFYEIISRYNISGAVVDTAVTLLKPAAKSDRLVVIDAGHGGTETGAVSNGLIEKALNLDIAIRLNKLLKAKGVKTYMIRENDAYVGLYERAYIANDLNAALFLSIHNNAFNSIANGTETLYYPLDTTALGGVTSTSFAKIAQDNLIAKLGTTNRGIQSRPGLAVLRKTKMPQILAEVAFVDQLDNAALLKTATFKQKAAEALCNAVLQTLQQMK